MKKNIFLALLAGAVLVSCKAKYGEKKKSLLPGFSAYYNTLFNSKDALNTELDNREKSHKDNFYAPYITLLKHGNQPLGESEGLLDDENVGAAAADFFGGNNNQKKGASILQISEAKALKTIAQYSNLKDGVEKNKTIFDAHILLAQARLYQDKPLEALDALSYLFSYMKKDKRLPLAKIYQAQAYVQMKDYFRANEIFLALKDDKIKKKYRKLYSVYYAEMLLAAGKKEQAVEMLEEAFSLNKNRELRSRIAFLRGQVLAKLGRNEEAGESFVTAYKYANNFEFEVKSQIELAKTFDGKNDNYEDAKAHIEKISKKGTYASRKNEFYYALGVMAKNAGKIDEAKDFFQKAKDGKSSDGQIRGLTYYEIGKYYADKKDYISAGAYYDSAVAVMTYQPVKEELEVVTKNIKNFSKNYYLIKKNDSILALTKMSDAEKNNYFAKHIEKLKEKEAKEEAERIKKLKDKDDAIQDGDYNANSIFANNKGTNFQDFSTNTNGKTTFYFANQNTVAKGQAEFKQIWGNRSLADNWRTSTKMASIEDAKNEALGLSEVRNPRRFEPSFYIEQIPTDRLKIDALKKDRDTASLGLGRMYENYFADTDLATKTLYNLVDNQPEEEVKLQALYQIFTMNYEKNPSAGERAKQLILSEFPYTHYAEFVKNPKKGNFSPSSSEVENLYQRAFQLYSEEKFAESQTLITQTLEKYPNDALLPKFTLLNAYNTGKIAGKEIMILQLQQLALNYPKLEEGKKATELLKYLQSDLKTEFLDDKGKAITQPQQKKTEEKPVIRAVEDLDTKKGNNTPQDNKNNTPVNNSGVGRPDDFEE
ncbi:MAG: tetratricopeptide repeat protein [Bergeyella zoohelcum]|nr:tetratricopeptide repeat protein [Bergeyella zoohelcum]